jgi:Na+/melibiose symporter-like transporter
VSFIVATLIFVAAMAAMVAAQVLPTSMVITLAAITGLGYSGMQVFPMAMLPDVITAEEQRTGARRAGLFAGVWTAGETLGFALGPGLYGLILSIGGYVSSTDSSAVQPESAVVAALIGFTVVPVVLVLAALPFLSKNVEARVDPRRSDPRRTKGDARA